MGTSRRGELLRERLARSRVASIANVAPSLAFRRERRCIGTASGVGNRQRTFHTSDGTSFGRARGHLDAHAVGFDRDRLLEVEVVARVIQEDIEVVEHAGENKMGFLPCEGATLNFRNMRKNRLVE